MGEHDRNANPEPLRVQTDFHPPVPAGADPHSAHYRSKARAEVGPSDGDPYLLLPVGGSSTMAAAVTMCKGHQRVSLITPEPLSELLPVEQEEAAAETGVVVTPSAANRRHFPNQGIFEVVVHGGEAYLIEMVLPIGVQQKNTNSSNSSNSKYKVVGLSTGWRHSLMIVENA